jgi:ribosome-binding protein aMBF1 (putative translation factor)
MNRYDFITNQNREAIVKVLKTVDIASLSKEIGINPITLKSFASGMWTPEMKTLAKIENYLKKQKGSYGE